MWMLNWILQIYFTGSSEGSASGSPCRDDWKGDGECDEVNNNAKCNYDGGDCPRKCFADDNDPLDSE